MDQENRRRRRLAKLLIAVPLTDAHLERLRRAFPEVDVVATGGRLDAEALADADAVVVLGFDAELLAKAPRLGWLQSGGAGVDNLPLPDLAAHGVLVSNASGVHAVNMGEHVLAMMLAFARGIPRLVRAQSDRMWRDEPTRSEVFELSGQTVLLVGVGDIGLAAGERAVAFGMRVLGARRRLDGSVPKWLDEVVPLDRLDDALARADHVVVSLPLTAATRGLFDADRLAAMRRGAYLYNVGRGAVVETTALVASLASGHLGGAGLDVVDPEPLPGDSPLWAMDNVLITAHTAGATPRYWDRVIEILVANVARYRDGEALLNEVDLAAGY